MLCYRQIPILALGGLPVLLCCQPEHDDWHAKFPMTVVKSLSRSVHTSAGGRMLERSTTPVGCRSVHQSRTASGPHSGQRHDDLAVDCGSENWVSRAGEIRRGWAKFLVAPCGPRG